MSRALLLQAATGRVPETFRIHIPGSVVAFGRRDVGSAGYPGAVAAARSHGFGAVERLTGGRAALFHPGTIAFSWAIPDPVPAERVRQRFTEVSEIIVSALAAVGTDARVGEVPGEYCPGEFSVNAGGTVKLMGVGQRMTRQGAHVGGVVVVTDAESVRRVLIPVYEALGLAWRPETAGAVQDVVPSVTVEAVIEAVVAALGARHHLEEGGLDDDTLALAEDLVGEHLSP